MTNSDLVALVDDEDYDRLAAFRWSATKGRRGDFYALRRAVDPETGKWRGRQMQRDVLDPDMTAPRSRLSDHRNHNTMDNQRHNLRWLNYQNSNQNRRLFKTNKSGYRGVSFIARGTRIRRWSAALHADGVRITGRYLTAEDAARAYNVLALLHHGEHAQLNVIPGDPA